ncbi:hypothetical protein AHFPHNDE_01668 [Pseudomonas sp. MM227]|uniref:hypothetical protein n=1 Tax=Pseudomonas sp. MM227 TaxID=3019968 RepID=UPI00222021B5|nr:hypothetical protein [Pseudomonas sp. MM227]CAI3787995.1 hypothetical protein AHFPHNDE_01668 [Pseudomonas sp. MM227]
MTAPPEREDSDLKVAQIERLRAETDKFKAERKKLEDETAAAPRRNKGAYWSEAAKMCGVIVLGVGGVITAVGSLLVAQNQVELSEIKSAQATKQAEIAEASIAAATKEVATAIQLRDKARKEEADASKAATELRDSLAVLTTQVKAANPALLKRHLVYIQFQGDLSRSVINDLRTALAAQHYSAPGAERLEGNYRSLVKYFKPEDEQAALSLVASTEAFFISKGCPIKLSAELAKSTLTSPPLELWLSDACKKLPLVY